MKLGLALLVAVSLSGCMQTSQQVAQQTVADINACRGAGAPVDQCMSDIRQQRMAYEQRRAAALMAPVYQPPVYQPPQQIIIQRSHTCANANLIGC